MRIVLARTRHVYGSYTYFWRLAEISGLEICYVDEIDLEAEVVYIFTPANGEIVVDGRLSPGFQAKHDALKGRPRKAKLIWWYIERPGGESLKDAAQAPQELRKAISWSQGVVDKIWTHDRHFAAMDPSLLCVPIGSDERLREGQAIRPYRYDVCHFLYVNHRRSGVLAAISKAGLRIGPPDWNEGRNAVWNSSRMILSMHQSDVPGGEQLRFAAAAAWAMPLVSETMGDPWPLERGKDILEFSYQDLAGGVVSLARSANDLSDLGVALKKRLCLEYPFERSIREGVSQTIGEVR